MKLVVGLGNPGRKYQETRHNVGFDVVQELARKHSVGGFRTKFKGEYCEANLGGQAAILLIPHTYMNLSGASVQPATVFFKIKPADLMVVCDDFNLPLARLRFRARGSSGGQKGLADILGRLGSQEISRLRIGIGACPPRWDVADYVLSKFQFDEQQPMTDAIGRAAEAMVQWAEKGIQHCMNQYNTAGGEGKTKKPAKQRGQSSREPAGNDSRSDSSDKSDDSESRSD